MWTEGTQVPSEEWLPYGDELDTRTRSQQLQDVIRELKRVRDYLPSALSKREPLGDVQSLRLLGWCISILAHFSPVQAEQAP